MKETKDFGLEEADKKKKLYFRNKIFLNIFTLFVGILFLCIVKFTKGICSFLIFTGGIILIPLSFINIVVFIKRYINSKNYVVNPDYTDSINLWVGMKRHLLKDDLHVSDSDEDKNTHFFDAT